MSRENLCAARGCNGACCRSVSIEMGEEEFALFTVHFPDGLSLEKIQLQRLMKIERLGHNGDNPNKLYYSVRHPDWKRKNGEVTIIFWAMCCPFLVGNICGIYDKPFRPKACEETTVDGGYCDFKRNGIIPLIPQDGSHSFERYDSLDMEH